MTASSIQPLRTEIAGQVIAPEDAQYESARLVFAPQIDRRPAAIVRTADASEVSAVVALARDEGLELAVRSGGHSVAGHGVSDGGIVLDLSRLKALEIDPDEQVAWAETGLTAGEVTNAAQAHGLAIGLGDTGSVGIGGLTLGGGDRLPRAQARAHDRRPARRRDRDRRRSPAARRRGQRTGSVLGDPRRRRQLRRRHPLPLPAAPGRDCHRRHARLPATPDVLAGFIAAAEAAPEELSTIANVMTAPPLPFLPEEWHGKLVVLAMLVHAGPLDEGERAVAPFRALAAPLADMVRPMPYSDIYPPEDPNYRPARAQPARCSSTRSTTRWRRRSSAGSRLDGDDARRAAARARWRDGAGSGGRHRVRAPAEQDHGQRGRDLRKPGRGFGP